MKKLLRIIALVILVILNLPVQMVLADTPDDAIVTLKSQRVFRNLYEIGDMLIVLHWRWETDNVSTTPASSGVRIALSLAGNEVTSTNPYVNPLFVDSTASANTTSNGYGEGVSSFYSAANPPAVWLGAYEIAISGINPPFTAVTPLTYTLTAADYSGNVSQTDARADLKDYLMKTADKLNQVYPAVTLKSTITSGVVLSENGEAYYRAVIPSLPSLCPDMFAAQINLPEPMPVQTYNMDLKTQLETNMSGSEIERGANRIGAYINVSGGVILGLITFVGCLWVLIWLSKKGWPLEAGLFICGAIVTGVASVIGDLVFTLVMIGSLLASMGIAWALFGKKS